MFQILLWSLWTYRCGQRTVRLADCGSQSQAVFARRRRRSKSKLKLLDIRAELERRENARVPEPDEMGNLIEEAVNLPRQINLELDRDDVHELLNSHNQELTIVEIEMHEQEQNF
ncbi:hypothetical protein TNCV_1097701 [Trichonephila clavipes]|nr:hypothetical protein TNCV_1097701 [Trichonephila clavipes]